MMMMMMMMINVQCVYEHITNALQSTWESAAAISEIMKCCWSSAS